MNKEYQEEILDSFYIKQQEKKKHRKDKNMEERNFIEWNMEYRINQHHTYDLKIMAIVSGCIRHIEPRLGLP
jgi:hypothetical protein